MAIKNQVASAVWIMEIILRPWTKSHKQICLRFIFQERVGVRILSICDERGVLLRPYWLSRTPFIIHIQSLSQFTRLQIKLSMDRSSAIWASRSIICRTSFCSCLFNFSTGSLWHCSTSDLSCIAGSIYKSYTTLLAVYLYCSPPCCNTITGGGRKLYLKCKNLQAITM